MWEFAHKEGWMMKNWCFQFVVLEKTLENPLDCKEIKPVSPKGDQSWVFTGRTVAWSSVLCTLYFGHLMQRPDSLEKTLILGKIEGKRQRGQQRVRWLDGITDLMDMGLGGLWVNSGSWWWTGRPGVLRFMWLQSRTWLSDWTELNWANNNEK